MRAVRVRGRGRRHYGGRRPACAGIPDRRHGYREGGSAIGKRGSVFRGPTASRGHDRPICAVFCHRVRGISDAFGRVHRQALSWTEGRSGGRGRDGFGVNVDRQREERRPTLCRWPHR